MKTKIEEFEVVIPSLDGADGSERVKVPVTLEWDDEVKQWLLSAEAHQIIEETKARLIGLLTPSQMKELRERYKRTQKQMGELFQVGEKSWTRWETGKQRPSRSMNLLIRALYDGEISIDYLMKRAGKVQADPEPTICKVSHFGSFLGQCWGSAIKATVPEAGELVYIHMEVEAKAYLLEAYSKGVHQSTIQGLVNKTVDSNRRNVSLKAVRRFGHENTDIDCSIVA